MFVPPLLPYKGKRRGINLSYFRTGDEKMKDIINQWNNAAAKYTED